jgi:PucR family transcriptional regulator, purine catabolism regulatory protein
MALTVADVLDLPVLRRGLPEVVAVAGSLGRELRWVHAGEVPNIASLLTGGELLLTTGMGLGDSDAEVRAFADRLAGRGVAALVVELGPRLPSLPPALVAAADAHDLPLVVLRREVPFVAVTEAVHTELVDARVAVLRRGDEVQALLTRVLLAGGDVPGVLAELAEVVGNPVFLEDPDGRLLFHAGTDDVDAWETARASGWPGAVGAPVASGSGRDGRLSALPLRAPLGEDGATAVARAADIVALALLRTRQEEELLARERGDVLRALAAGRLTPAEAARQAATLGFPGDGPLLVVAAEATGPVVPATWAPAIHDAQRALQADGGPALLGTAERATGLLGLLAVDDPQRRPERAAAAAHAIRAAAPGVVVVAGPVVGWDAAGPALALTAEQAAAARSLPAVDWHDGRTLELQRLLWRWRSDGDLQAFAARVLAPLLDHDATRRAPLLPTLEALCAHGGNKAQAARALHLNRQALYPRLDRIGELLDADLDDPETLLTLSLAVRAHRLARDDA